jgi:Tol biopolymer transport system component
MSPDGRQVAVLRSVNDNADIWLLEVGRGFMRRLTFDAGLDILPIWSPDGGRIAFSSNRRGQLDLYLKPANGAGIEELLLATPEVEISQDWSPDGRVLLYRSRDPKGDLDLWALPLDGERKPIPVTQTDFNEKDAQFSPDGKWIAYQSDESGRFEIYVQSFTGPGGKSQISVDGGAQVRWRRDGRELFYIGLDNRLMAAPIRLDSAAMVIEAGAPVPLFATRVGGAVLNSDSQQYVVSTDGQRFLMNTVVEEAVSPLTVILNWKPGSRSEK